MPVFSVHTSIVSRCQHCSLFQIDPLKRPSMKDIVVTLEEIMTRSQMATVLADISSLSVGDGDQILNKTILDKILSEFSACHGEKVHVVLELNENQGCVEK